MSIIRVKKERQYVSIANAMLQNKKLSWEARGVMAYLLSKPDGWECRNYDLVNQGPASAHVIRRVLKELQEAGYIYRYQKSEGRNTIEWITEIYESPDLNTAFRNTDFSKVENFESESFKVEKLAHIVSTDSQQELITEKTDLIAPQKSNDSGFDHADQVERNNLNNLADQIAKICNLDIDLTSKKTRDSLKTVTLALYGKNTGESDLNSFKAWWYNEYWAGKKGQAPTPAQVGDTWGQFEASKESGQVPNHTYTPNLSEAKRKRLFELIAENEPK